MATKKIKNRDSAEKIKNRDSADFLSKSKQDELYLMGLAYRHLRLAGTYSGTLIMDDDNEDSKESLRFTPWFGKEIFLFGDWKMFALPNENVEIIKTTIDGSWVEFVEIYMHQPINNVSEPMPSLVKVFCPISSLNAALELARKREFRISADVMSLKYQLEANADLREADLSFAELDGLDLSNTNLAYADLHRASLIGCKLSGANLTGANLAQANLTGTDFRDADLKSAVIKDSCIVGASFLNADMHGMRMSDGTIHP